MEIQAYIGPEGAPTAGFQRFFEQGRFHDCAFFYISGKFAVFLTYFMKMKYRRPHTICPLQINDFPHILFVQYLIDKLIFFWYIS